MLFPTYLSGCKCQLIKDGEPRLFANLNTTSQQTRGKGRDIWDEKIQNFWSYLLQGRNSIKGGIGACACCLVVCFWVWVCGFDVSIHYIGLLQW